MIINKNIIELIENFSFFGDVNTKYKKEYNEGYKEETLIVSVKKIDLVLRKNQDGEDTEFINTVRITKLDMEDILQANELLEKNNVKDTLENYICTRTYKIQDKKLICTLTMIKDNEDEDYDDDVEYRSKYEVCEVNHILPCIERFYKREGYTY